MVEPRVPANRSVSVGVESSKPVVTFNQACGESATPTTQPQRRSAVTLKTQTTATSAALVAATAATAATPKRMETGDGRIARAATPEAMAMSGPRANGGQLNQITSKGVAGPRLGY